jgi:hypothetical protein
MKVYFWKRDGKVFYYAAENEAEAKSHASHLDGFTTAPDSSAAIEEWEAAGSVAHINAAGEIVLGEPDDVKAMRDEIGSLTLEETALQSELDSKDYKVIKASEAGDVLAETEPELHERRQWCRNRINEIRERLAELRAIAHGTAA